jgi:hypothetical protein
MQDGITNFQTPQSEGGAPPSFDAAAAAAFRGQPIPPVGVAPTDPYSDDVKLLECFRSNNKRCADRRVSFERVWWRLLLYILGRQWIYFDKNAGSWVDKRLQKWIPRPVTNKILETLETILSVFQSVELSASCRPEGGSPDDIMAAETANRYESPMKDDHEWPKVQREHDWWLTALGNAALFIWWDYSGDSSTAFVPWEQCTACGEVSSPVAVKQAGDCCPTCKCPVLDPAKDPMGKSIGTSVSSGHGRTDVVSPLEVSFPPVYSDPNDSDVIIRRRWRPKEYYEARLDPVTLEKIRWETQASERSLQLLRSLSASTDISSLPNSSPAGEPAENEGTTEAEMWLKPTKDYPDGLVLRVIETTTEGSGIVLRMPEDGLPGPIPNKTVEGKMLWPWIFTGYGKLGGRGWARSPLESLIEKQNQINQIDSLIQLIIQRCANPVWLEPKGADVTKFSGEPGLVVKYNPLAAGGSAKPERIEGANVPASLVTVREMLVADMESMAGTQDVLKGNKPAGVEAFSAMQLLVERSQSRYGPVLEARGVSYRRWFKIALEMERQYGPEDRAMAIMGPNGYFQREEFKKANLDGSIRVEVEDGSQMPKTSLGTRAAIQQLAALQAIDLTNPETSYRVLQIFGRTDLYPGLDAQVTGARRAQQAFEQWAAQVQFIAQPPAPIAGPTGALLVDPMSGQPATQPQPPAPSIPPPIAPEIWQKSEVYVAEHMKWANSDRVQELMQQRPEIKPFVTAMIQAHMQKLAMEQMQAQATQPAPGKPNAAAGKDGHGAGAGRALHNSNQESGNPNDLNPPPAGAS